MTTQEIIPPATRVRGAKFIVIAMVVYAVLRLAGVHGYFSGDAEGIAALLQIIGTLYSVVYAFATYVIWGQFAAVENEIVQEAGALKDLVLFSKSLKEATREPIVRAVKAYARGVMETEWGVLAHGEGTDRTDKLFSGVIASVVEANPQDESEQRAYQSLLAIAGRASAARDERLATSAKRIPRTLLLFVSLTAVMILFLLLLFPFRNLALGVVSVAITTMLLYFAHFVLTDLDNPFEGTWNVDSEAFRDLAAEAR